MTCQSVALLKGLSGGLASQSINLPSGSHQVAIWRLTRALSHGALQLSGAASVYCVVKPIKKVENTDLQLAIIIRQTTTNVKENQLYRQKNSDLCFYLFLLNKGSILRYLHNSQKQSCSETISLAVKKRCVVKQDVGSIVILGY